MQLGGLDHVDRPRVFLLSTTHGAETHALAAAIATHARLPGRAGHRAPDAPGERLRRAGRAVIHHHRLDDFVTSWAGRLPVYGTRDLDGNASQAFRTLLLQETIRRGVLMPSLVVSYSHTDEDIDRTIAALDGALAVYRRPSTVASRVPRRRASEPVMRNYNTIRPAVTLVSSRRCISVEGVGPGERLYVQWCRS